MRDKILAYLLMLLVCAILWLLNIYYVVMPADAFTGLVFYTVIWGMIGGVVQCLRAYYMHVCAQKDWEDIWAFWYVVRPLLGAVMGVVSFVFIKAGFLIFSTQPGGGGVNFAYAAVAFLAGFNVNGFIEKIQDISKIIISPSEVPTKSTEEAVRKKAYSLWQKAGKPAGEDQAKKFWFEAEKDVKNL